MSTAQITIDRKALTDLMFWCGSAAARAKRGETILPEQIQGMESAYQGAVDQIALHGAEIFYQVQNRLRGIRPDEIKREDESGHFVCGFTQRMMAEHAAGFSQIDKWAKEYHDRCEAFDRSIHPSGRFEAMTGDQRQLCVQNSRKVEAEIRYQVNTAGFIWVNVRLAIREYDTRHTKQS